MAAMTSLWTVFLPFPAGHHSTPSIVLASSHFFFTRRWFVLVAGYYYIASFANWPTAFVSVI